MYSGAFAFHDLKELPIITPIMRLQGTKLMRCSGFGELIVLIFARMDADALNAFQVDAVPGLRDFLKHRAMWGSENWHKPTKKLIARMLSFTRALINQDLELPKIEYHLPSVLNRYAYLHRNDKDKTVSHDYLEMILRHSAGKKTNESIITLFRAF